MKKTIYLLAITLGIFIIGCNNTSDHMTKTENKSVILHTSKGDISLELYTVDVPTIAENFYNLAKDGKYDGVVFHRVIPGFMIQGGDFENGNGTGGYAYGKSPKDPYIEDVFVKDLTHDKGVISMANRGPNTNGSQFFIMHDDAPHLDGRHSVFGYVTDGMDIVDAIVNAKRDISDRPLEDIVIERVTTK